MTTTPLLRFTFSPPSPSPSPSPSTHRHSHRPTLTPHPLKPPTLSLLSPKPHHPKSRKNPSSISSSYNNNSTTPVPDRLISSLSYFFPFFNGLQYGRFLFAQYPKTLGLILEPFLPLLSFYRSVPYSSYLAFLILYIGVVRNTNVSRYARFNAMQAVVLDVLLVLPMLVQRIFNPGPHGLSGKVLMWSHNVIFVGVVVCFVYTFGYSVLGKTPKLPYVGDAADRQF